MPSHNFQVFREIFARSARGFGTINSNRRISDYTRVTLDGRDKCDDKDQEREDREQKFHIATKSPNVTIREFQPL